jgi:imidazole glycerol phosphate synthase glutamine amidotransferase subunit
MAHLKKYELDQMIREIVEEQKPLLGICLGLQLLFQESEESPGIEGLGILPGRIRKIPAAAGLKIPHIGWNSLQLKNQGRLFEGVSDGAYVYFVHSYYLVAKEEHMVKATTQYGVISMLPWRRAMFLHASSIRRKAVVWGFRYLGILQAYRSTGTCLPSVLSHVWM